MAGVPDELASIEYEEAMEAAWRSCNLAIWTASFHFSFRAPINAPAAGVLDEDDDAAGVDCVAFCCCVETEGNEKAANLDKFGSESESDACSSLALEPHSPGRYS